MYARLLPSDDNDDDDYDDGDDYNNDNEEEGVVEEEEERDTGRLQGTPRGSRGAPYGSAATRHVLRLRWITYIRRRYLSALFYLLLFLALHCLGVLSPFVPSLNLPNSPPSSSSSSLSSSTSLSSSLSLISSPPKRPTTVTVADEILQGISASTVDGSSGRGGSGEASILVVAAAATVVADGGGRPVEDIPLSANRLLSVSEVFTYFLEYLGFCVRLLTFLPLIAGSVICLRHLYGHCLLTSPCIKPVLCGVIAGLMGLYGEVLLWLAVTLLRPSPVLLQSQLCCTLAASCCLLAGLCLSCRSSATSPSSALTPGSPPLAHRDNGGLVMVDPLDAPSAFVYGDLFRPSRRRRRRPSPLALRHDVSPHPDVREGARHRRVGVRRERCRYDVNGEVVTPGDDDDDDVEEVAGQFLQLEDERCLQASAISELRAVEEDRRFDHKPRGPVDADSGAWPHLGDCNCPQCHGKDSPASRDRKSPSVVLSPSDRPEDVFNVDSDVAAERLLQRLPPQERKRWRSVGDENRAIAASGWDDRAVEAASREVCFGPPYKARPGISSAGSSHRHDFRQAEVHCPLHNPRGGRLVLNNPPRRRSHPMSSQGGALVNNEFGEGAEFAHHRYLGKVDVPMTRPRRYSSIRVLQHPQQYEVSDYSACYEEFVQHNSRRPSDTKQPRRNRTDSAVIKLSPDGEKEATLPEAVSIQIDDSASDRVPTVKLSDAVGQDVIFPGAPDLDPGNGSAARDDNRRDLSKASVEGQLSNGADFDHSTNYIDDDLYYHTSDDDHLETFIVHNSAANLGLAAGGPEMGTSGTGREQAGSPKEGERGGRGDVSEAGTTDPGSCGLVVVEAASGSASSGLLRAPVHSLTMTACTAPVEETSAGSSPDCLKATDRSLMLTFYDSQEYLSLTDDDDDDDNEAVKRGGVVERTNKTWP